MEIMSSGAQKMDFMKLLVTELQNQNPLEPLDNQQMAAQLAQFSQLEQSEQMNANLASMNATLTEMNSNYQTGQLSQVEQTAQMNANVESMNSTMTSLDSRFGQAMVIAQFDYAKSLLGKEVSFYSTDHEQSLSGVVEGIAISGNEPMLQVRGSATLPDGSEFNGVFPVRTYDISGIND